MAPHLAIKADVGKLCMDYLKVQQQQSANDDEGKGDCVRVQSYPPTNGWGELGGGLFSDDGGGLFSCSGGEGRGPPATHQ